MAGRRVGKGDGCLVTMTRKVYGIFIARKKAIESFLFDIMTST